MKASTAPLALAALAALGAAPAPAGWKNAASPTTERLRGVSAVSAKVAWASGHKGTVVRTTDGGATFARVSPPDSEALDFRDVEAFDEKRALVLAIGPGDASRIYRTSDGGASWTRVFTNADPKAFYDAMAFRDEKNGLAYGDPVDGKHTLLRTTDGGATWALLPPAGLPAALENEAAFAASGTCLAVQGAGNAWIATGGGATSRVLRSSDGGLSWAAADAPIPAGAASAGLFSIAFSDARRGVIVGGDYKKESEGGPIAARTEDGGATWTLSGKTPRSFRSAVAYVPGTKGRVLLAVGPGGTDSSSDGGATWRPEGDDGFHALSIAKDGTAWAAGEGGRVASRRAR